MTDNDVCTSTGAKITNDAGAVKFKCPKCSGPTIVRGKNSRAIGAKYKCPECGFEGPN